ncbi:MAG: Gluconolactonase precursor [Chloroflexi bacterium ADurb.Bin325]|nr:MAG: Gluconolactonase precursor [Chloroflexi bacterium ADurb.Bin325]
MEMHNSDLYIGEPERIATGFQFVEGPVWLPDGFLLFSDIPASRIYKLTPEGAVSVWREPSNHSNGLTLDRQGRLLACEHGSRRVSVADIVDGQDGGARPLAAMYGGKRLNSPNDIVVRSDGLVYFTDPPYGIEPDQQEQPVNAVYCVRPGGEPVLVAKDFNRPNGLVFAPDEAVLYIGDSRAFRVQVYDVAADGALHNSRLFADASYPEPGSPDGMKVDVEGNLYVCNALGVWTFAPDATFRGLIPLPETPANCAWGDDGRSFYVTARTSVYRIRTRIAGRPPVVER